MSFSFDEFTKRFLEKRVQKEKFSVEQHSFYIHSPIRQYVQLLLTGFVKDYYYMKASEVVELSKIIHNEVIKQDEKFHLEGLKVSRQSILMKDQPIIGILMRLKPEYNLRDKTDEYVEILSTYPVDQLVNKFVTPIRNKQFGYGLGRYVRRLLTQVLNKYEEKGILKYYVVRYKSALRDLVNLIHYKLNEDYARIIFNKDLDKVQDEYLKAYVKFIEKVKEKKYEEAAKIVEEYSLPFELIRSNIPRSYYSKPDVYNAILKTIPAFSLALNTISLIQNGVPIDEIKKVLERRLEKVTTYEIFRPLYLAYRKFGLNHELTKTLGSIYAKKLTDVWKQIELNGLLKIENLALIIDFSGSMARYVDKLVFTLAPLGLRTKHLILFSEYAKEEDPELLLSIEGLDELIKKFEKEYGGGTNIQNALELANELNVDVVFLSTDEQANLTGLSRLTETELIRKLVKRGVNVIIHNPSPYPVHITHPLEGVTYIYGDRVEAIIGSLRLQKMRSMDDDKVKELLLKLPKEKLIPAVI